jgi:DHA3 family tetracycline resistance protein-like MFS transporter
MHSNLISRNIRLYYAIESILSLTGGIILPVYVVYFRNFDITLFQVAFLAALFEATIIIFEVPTGTLADKYGRKLSTIIGLLLYALSGFIFFRFTNFVGFIIAEIIFGIAETFISGALEALAVDSLDESKRDNYLPKLFANRTLFKTSFLLIGILLGGFLAGSYLSNLFVPFILIALIGFVLALFLKEARIITSSEGKRKDSQFSIKQLLLRNPIVLALFAVGLFANFAYEPADQFWQVLFSEIKNIEASYFGMIAAAGLILVIAVSKFSGKLYNRLSLYLSICFILIALSLYITANLTIYPALAGIVIYFALKELIRPVISAHLNRALSSERRATYLSAYNMTCSVGEVIAGITAGLLAARFGVLFIFYFSAVAAVFVMVVFLIIARLKT